MTRQDLPKMDVSKKPRFGARGARKVKTGCLTCKTRRKKCDERRPACSRCSEAGWTCDYLPRSPSPSPLLSDDNNTSSAMVRILPRTVATPLLYDERGHMDYFRHICAPEMALYFEVPAWQAIVMQGTMAEPALHHAALAIASLSRNRYHPATWDKTPAMAFSMRHYTLAIQALYKQLNDHNNDNNNHSPQIVELAVLASVVFSLVEFLLGFDDGSRLQVHLRAGSAMLRTLFPDQEHDLLTTTNRNSELTTHCGLLSDAMCQLTGQVTSFIAFSRARQ